MRRVFTAAAAAAAVVVVLAVPAAWPAASDGYRVTLAVRLTTGASGAHPIVGLLALIDDGRGPAGAAGAPPATGEVVFTLGRRHLAPGAVRRLFEAPRGTQIGYLTLTPGGGGIGVQNAVRTLGSSTDPVTGESLLALKADVEPDYSPVVGKTIPLSLRVTEQDLVITLNTQLIVRRFQAKRQVVRFTAIGIYLLGSMRLGGVVEPLTENPAEPARPRSSVAARPCVGPECGRLGDTAGADTAASVPKAVSVLSPARAPYGLPVTFSGTASDGDSVQLAFQRAPRSARACTPVSTKVCAPRYGPAWDKVLGSPVARVGDDGRWSITAELRSVPGSALTAAHPATGRYAAVVFSGPGFQGGLNGGPAAVFTAASQPTRVRLAQPRLMLVPSGIRLGITVRVPGGDEFVGVTVRFGARVVARGRLDEAGRFSRTIASPGRAGVFRAAASVAGAEAATTARPYEP